MLHAGGRVSLAMIVRDEAEHLAACLESVAALQPEIVVVDTGSVDATPDIALAHGARVVSAAWTGCFSEARNRSLEECTRPWILILDADERIAAEDLPALAELVAGEPVCGYRFTTRNYTDQRYLTDFTACAPEDANAHGFPGWFPSTKVRLFPRDARIRFSGTVHELVNPALLALQLPLLDCPVPVHHYPLEREAARIEAKREMYLRLGQEKAQSDPENPKVWEELAEQYIELGHIAEAAAAYRQAVSLAPSEARLLAGLGSVLAIAGLDEPAAVALDLALRIDPTQVSALRNRAILHLQSGEGDAAEPLLRRVITLRPGDSEQHRYLAIALDQAGKEDDALIEARRAVALAPSNAEAVALEADLAGRVG
jgi:cytochrome c-type biogenesis protein CcmH/NrfG